MIYKFIQAHRSLMMKPPEKGRWKYMRKIFCLWILLIGILSPVKAQNQILGLKFDTYGGNERFGLIEADDFIHPGLVIATDSATAIVSRSSGITPNAIEAFEPESYAACSWSANNAIDTSDYFNIRIEANSGNVMNLTRFKLFLQRNQYGPTKITIRSDVTGDTDLLTQVLYFGGPYEFNIDLTSFGTDFQSLDGPVNFRVYGWEGSAAPDQENCLRIENTDEEGYDLEIEGCVSYPAFASFMNPLAQDDTICSGETIKVQLSANAEAGIEGTDYSFTIHNISYDNGNDGIDGMGYGPVEGGILEPQEVLSGPSHIRETLINTSAEVVKIIYEIQTTQTGDNTCQGAILEVEVVIAPRPMLALIGDAEGGVVCGRLGDGMVSLRSYVADTSAGLKATKFKFLDDEWSLVDETHHIDAGVPQDDGSEAELGAGTYYVLGIDTATMCSDTIEVDIARWPERPDVVYNHPVANRDTICSGDTINVGFKLPESLSDLSEGDFEFVITNIRSEESDDLGNGEALRGYGHIITSTNYQEGDTVPHGLQTVLSNPTDNLVRISYRVNTVLNASPACEAEPYRWVNIIIMPAAPQLGVSWVVNTDTLENDTITLCVNDTLSRMMVNLSEELDMIARQITDVATYDMNVSAGDTIHSMPVTMGSEMAGTSDRIVLVTYPDINSNGMLDPVEMACPSDTIVYIINVLEPILFTLQPESINTCEGDSVIFTTSVNGENGGEWQYMYEGSWLNTGDTDTVLTYPGVDGSMDGRQIRYAAYHVCDTVYSDTVTLGVDTDCNLEITDPCNCLVNESEPGAGDGQFSETFTVTGPAGMVVLMGDGSYELYDFDSENPPATLTAWEAGDTIPEVSPGVYELTVKALNGTEYSINVAINTPDNVIPDLTITKTCEYTTPAFTLQPQDTTVCVGADASFTVTVQDADSISCQVKLPGDSVFAEVSGKGGLGGVETTETYDLTHLIYSHDGLMYRVVAYNCGTAISDSATLHVDSVSAGTLIPETITCMDTTLDLFASHGDMPFAPAGYDTLYVLTKGDELIIVQTDIIPAFTVTETGTYTIHTLVGELKDDSDPNYIDLEGFVELGVTPVSDVVSAIQTYELYADLDVTGARFEVERCNAIGTCENLTIVWEITDWDADHAGADPYNHVLYFYESLIDGTQGDHPLLSRFTLDGAGQIIMRNDTAIVTGVATSKADTTAKLDMMLVLTSPENYDDWSESGRTWLAQLPEANAVASTDHPNWTYWILDTTSRLTGLGSLTGTQLSLSHTPEDFIKGIQQDYGANDKDGDLGFGGWFMYEGDVVYNGNTTYINSQGDLNSNLVSSDTICDLPIIGPIVNNFTVQAVSDDAVQIVWSTLTDGNGGYIVVERSVDGQIFEQVTVMEGTDGQFNPEVHSLMDMQNGGQGKFYYRLKIVKPDGTFAYTNVVEITLDGIQRQAYLIYPNPVQQGRLNIQVIHPDHGAYVYEIYQLDGRRLIREELNAADIQVDVDHLLPGMYILKIIDPDGSEHVQRISVNP